MVSYREWRSSNTRHDHSLPDGRAVEIYYHDLRTEFLERSSTWMGVHQRAGIDTAIPVVVIHYFLISL